MTDKNDDMIYPGQIVVVSGGDWEDGGVFGVIEAVKEFNELDVDREYSRLVDAYLCDRSSQRVKPGRFIDWIVNVKKLAKPVEYKEIFASVEP